jgi:hypothetical protein
MAHGIKHTSNSDETGVANFRKEEIKTSSALAPRRRRGDRHVVPDVKKAANRGGLCRRTQPDSTVGSRTGSSDIVEAGA